LTVAKTVVLKSLNYYFDAFDAFHLCVVTVQDVSDGRADAESVQSKIGMKRSLEKTETFKS
jgi:hypothetical protein